jgi:NAD(P)-dependent dehydrogenase (short-subunit alcohol dehydrogenase family)
MIVKTLSVDLAPRGIVVVSLHPGWVKTALGGPSAPLSTDESVRGLRRVVESLAPTDSGRFLAHDGTEIAW